MLLHGVFLSGALFPERLRDIFCRILEKVFDRYKNIDIMILIETVNKESLYP